MQGRRGAERLGVNFADAAGWNIRPGPDGVHFTEDGHRSFAKALKEELSRIFSEESDAVSGQSV